MIIHLCFKIKSIKASSDLHVFLDFNNMNCPGFEIEHHHSITAINNSRIKPKFELEILKKKNRFGPSQEQKKNSN